jgi:hypothetical protein
MTELMILLVFMAIAFSFLAKKEGLKEIPRLRYRLEELMHQNAKLENELTTTRRENLKLKAHVSKLEQFLSEIGIDGKTLEPISNTIRFGGKTYKRLSGHAPGRPGCALPSHFLLEFRLLSNDVIAGTSLQNEDDGTKSSAMAGLNTLASGRPLSLGQFRDAAYKLAHSSGADHGACVFAVKAFRVTNNAKTFDAELSLIQQYFYVSHN